MPSFPKKVITLSLFACALIAVGAVHGQESPKPGSAGKIPALLNSLPPAPAGITAVTVIMQASEAAQLFPADPKRRRKADFPAIVTDGRNTFLGTLAPGGQSSLEVTTPNLRLSDLEEVVPGQGGREGKGVPTLAGVPVLDRTLRLNPMTMDEGYVNTLTYLELLNQFGLVPDAGRPFRGEYARLTYRFVDARDQWAKAANPVDGRLIEAVPAGLHLSSFNPVKYLKELDSGSVKILAVARSRYNILNKLDATKKFFGVAEAGTAGDTFSSAEVKEADVGSFRVELKWAKKTKAEKDQDRPIGTLENTGLLKALLVKAYAASRRFQGEALVAELDAALDLGQLFRFMALNRLLENGDISDEFFWYVTRDETTGATRLGILPQDGDDLFKGAHLFPTTPKQIGLILKGSGLGRKLGLEYGYIMNYEDPLFRLTRDDPHLFHRYLVEFEKMAVALARPPVLDRIMGGIAAKIAPYAADPEVRARGRTDARGRAYSPASFAAAVRKLQARIRKNAATALAALHGTRNRPGDLARAAHAAGVPETRSR